MFDNENKLYNYSPFFKEQELTEICFGNKFEIKAVSSIRKY